MKLKFTAKPKDALIFLLFAIFLLYLVAIGVMNIRYIAVYNRFWGLNPFPAFGREFILTTITLYTLALLAVIMGTSDKFYSREKGFGFGKAKEKDEAGWARWMKDDEMKNAYNVKKIVLNEDTYEHAGIPIILNDKEAWVDDGENHSLIIGASGSGKTATILDPQVKILGKAGESMVITDPKGEIYEHNANMLRDKGYNVVIVNFRDPEQGSAWNPLTLPYQYYKMGKEDKAMELLEDLATNILVDANNNDPFWQKSAADYFTGLALGLFEDAKSEKEVNLNSINAMSTFGEDRCGASKYDKEYFKIKGELSSAYISASATVMAPADTKGGITSTFRQKIRIFSSRPKLAEMLSYTDFDVRKIGSEKTAIFLKVHDEKTTYHALATIFVKQVYECLIDEAQKTDNLKLKVRTNFILDEFANMPALKDVESMITASRSRNIRFSFGIQNFSQLNKVYGKEVAETIKGNCGNMFYLITTEYAALEEISKLLGDVKPKVEKDKPQPPIRPLMTVSDLQQMKKFEMIIKRFRNQPFKTKHTPTFEIFKSKKGGWGFEDTISGYPTRETTEIETFDIKKFVDEHRKDEFGEENPMGGNPFIPPFGMPSMNKGMFGTDNNSSNIDDLVKNIDAQIAKLEEEERLEKEKLQKEGKSSPDENDFEKIINQKYEEYKNGESKEEKEEKEEKLPVQDDDIFDFKEEESNVNVDDLIKRIDAKIAELEQQEELEKEKQNDEKVEETTNNIFDYDMSKFEEDKEEKVNSDLDSLNPFMENDNEQITEEVKPVSEDIVDERDDIFNDLLRVEPTKEESSKIDDTFIKEANDIQDDIEEEIEKPNINIDVDSIVVDDNITDDEFFDDFFGDED